MKTLNIFWLCILALALRQIGAVEHFLRKEYPEGKDEIAVKNGSRCVKPAK